MNNNCQQTTIVSFYTDSEPFSVFERLEEKHSLIVSHFKSC